MDWTFIYWCSMIIIQFINISFHSCGLYLLRCLCRNGNGDVQTMLVMNLSATEVLLNFTYIVLFSLHVSYEPKVPSNIKEIMTYIAIISGACFNLVYYLSMIYIAINKMLEVLLNIKYPIYCNNTTVKYVLVVSWIGGIITASSVLLADVFANLNYHDPLVTFYTVLDILFIFIAGGSYSYIFHRYRQARITPPHIRCMLMNPKQRKQSLWRTFQGSRFYISFILIITFIFLQVIPKIILFFVVKDKHSGTTIKAICAWSSGVLYHVSFLVDAFVYVFLHRPVKQLLWKKLSEVRFLRRFVPSKSHVLRNALQAQLMVASPAITSTRL